MTQDLQKYMFDHHNFDVGAIDLDHPPAPTFSEQELDAAKAAGFAEGHRKGLIDAQASRDQEIAGIIAHMARGLTALTEQETERHAIFQADAVRVAADLYQKTFPILNDQFALPQLTTTIQTTLQTLDHTTAVQIEVAAEDLNDLADRLKPFLSTHEGQITLVSGTTLTPGSFHITWQHGGAVRDTNVLSERLTAALQQTLSELPEPPAS